MRVKHSWHNMIVQLIWNPQAGLRTTIHNIVPVENYLLNSKQTVCR